MTYWLVRELAVGGIPVAVTCRVLKFAKQPYYRWLQSPVSRRDGDDAHLINAAIDVHADDPAFGYRFIADEQGDAEEQAMDRFLSEEIESALRTLPPRDAKVLRLYFGLDGGREHTLEEIGGMLGVTRERVRQLRDRALKRLREGDVGRALASFAA